MANQCELLENCGFFNAYQATKNLVCQGFILQYCRGPKMDECVRKRYRKEHGSPPPDDLMPTGRTMSE